MEKEIKEYFFSINKKFLVHFFFIVNDCLYKWPTEKYMIRQ